MKILLGGKRKIKYPLPLKDIMIKLINKKWGAVGGHCELIIHGNGEGIYKGGSMIKKLLSKKAKYLNHKFLHYLNMQRKLVFLR